MRVAAALFLLTYPESAQLTPDDLTLYDNTVPRATQMDWMAYPISLVVAVQTSSNSGAVIDKLGGSGILFTQLLSADAGETAR